MKFSKWDLNMVEFIMQETLFDQYLYFAESAAFFHARCFQRIPLSLRVLFISLYFNTRTGGRAVTPVTPPPCIRESRDLCQFDPF